MSLKHIRWIYGITILCISMCGGLIASRLLPSFVAWIFPLAIAIWFPIFFSARDALLVRHEACEIYKRSTEHMQRLIGEVKSLRKEVTELQAFKAGVLRALSTRIDGFKGDYEPAIDHEKLIHIPDLSVLEDIELLMLHANADAIAIIEEEHIRHQQYAQSRRPNQDAKLHA